MAWTPKHAPNLNWAALDLTAEEGFLLSRVDGSTTVEQLGQLTGLAPKVLEGALQKLLQAGALVAPAGAEPTAPSPAVVGTASARTAATLPEAEEPEAPADTAPTERTDAAEQDDDDDEDDDKDAPEHPGTGEYRKLFETTLHPLPRDERMGLALKASGPQLMALCFDPDSAVVRNVLENALAGFEHARLVAMHHRNAQGLDALSSRAELVRDAQVQRLLLRNPQLSDGLFQRIMANRPLRPLYKTTMDREVTDRTRTRARTLLRTRFSTAQPEERVELIMSTEGRALNALSGLPLDGRTTSLLCARPMVSQILVQNLARFPGILPPLLVHLMKQVVVKRSPSLRTLILQHPNAPADLKKRG